MSCMLSSHLVEGQINEADVPTLPIGLDIQKDGNCWKFRKKNYVDKQGSNSLTGTATPFGSVALLSRSLPERTRCASEDAE